MNTQGLSVPVGAVLPYAGNLNNNQLNTLGWSVCDGATLSIKEYPELFEALGTCNGGDGNSHFNIPDYQGYFLRGVDPTGTIDKNAATRTAPRSGGASGATVGSIEGFSTAAPKNTFHASVEHVPTDDHNAYSGSNADMLEPGGAQTFSSSGGGDLETRPLNAYVNFIIKIVSNAAMPTGIVVPFSGGSPSGSLNLLPWYRNCDGSSLPQTLFEPLYTAIGKAHGGDEKSFNVPDYRGRFLRGVDNGTGRDLDASSRAIMAAGGASGDAVGSVQAYATALPVNPFTITINLGNSVKESDHCQGHDNSAWNPGSVTVSFTDTGGDAESRPVNVAVDYYVLYQTDPNTTDIFPVGAVIGFPGNVPPPNEQWLLCDGSSLSNSGQYAALYYAIGYANGGDGAANFNLPDLQGYFLRGADRGQGRDPDAITRTAAKGGGAAGDNVGSLQGYATGKPHTDITGNISHLPTSDSSNAAAIWCSSVAEWDGGQSPCVGGGDSETRPINVNLAFYIKYAQTLAS